MPVSVGDSCEALNLWQCDLPIFSALSCTYISFILEIIFIDNKFKHLMAILERLTLCTYSVYNLASLSYQNSSLVI